MPSIKICHREFWHLKRLQVKYFTMIENISINIIDKIYAERLKVSIKNYHEHQV